LEKLQGGVGFDLQKDQKEKDYQVHRQKEVASLFDPIREGEQKQSGPQNEENGEPVEDPFHNYGGKGSAFRNVLLGSQRISPDKLSQSCGQNVISHESDHNRREKSS